MLKSVFSFLMVFISFSALANLDFVTYEDYVHFSEKQKEAYVIKVMKHVVELEAQYKKETALYGYSEERFEKYKRVLVQIQQALFLPNAEANPDVLAQLTRDQQELAKLKSLPPTKDFKEYSKRTLRIEELERSVRQKGASLIPEAQARERDRALKEKTFPEIKRLMAATKEDSAKPRTPKQMPGLSRNANPSWEDIAKSFRDLSTRSSKEGNCLFAGWVSRIVKTAKGEEVCAHPDFIGGEISGRTITLENKNYPAAESGDCAEKNGRGNRNFIQCNPAVFGYKKMKGLKKPVLYCVPTNNMAEDSAYTCMQQALNPELPDADPLEERMGFLKTKFNDQKHFNAIFNFNYKTCVCSAVPHKDFSKQYQNYMRPDPKKGALSQNPRFRTCAGMMRMMSEIQKGCEVTGHNPGLFQAFEEYLASTEKSVFQTSGKEADEQYLKFITEKIRNDDRARTAFNAICPNEDLGDKDPVKEAEVPKEVVPGYTCEASCKKTSSPGEDKAPVDELTCETKVKDKEGKLIENLTIAEKPSSPEQQSLKIKPEISGKSVELECAITWEKPAEKPEDGNKDTLKLSVNVIDKTTTHYKIEASWEGEGWTLSWNIKDPDLKVKKDWEKKPETIAVAPDDTKPTVEGPGKVISQERIEKDYEVCGTIKKEDKTTTECAKVDKKGSAPAALNPTPRSITNPGLPQQQLPMLRGTSDTSATGIR